MRVLLRSCPNGDQYVWKKAEMKDARTFALEDGTCVYQAGIVSISRDNRKKFVKCSSCGAIVRNTPEAIKEHTDRASTSASCFGCQYMREGDGKQLSAKYTLQEDGSYVVNTKKSTRLYCRASFRFYDINSPEAREVCRFKGCATAEMRPIEDVFTKYPGLFDDIITVDRILENGFTEKIEYKHRGVTYYKLKGRNHITAIVNKLNIVDRFVICYRSQSFDVVYSKKYNKLFLIDGSWYKEYNSSESIPDKTIKSIKEKIASLYN